MQLWPELMDSLHALWGYCLIAIQILCILGVTYNCLKHRRQSDSALLWMLITFVIPFGGAVLYLFLGIDRVAGEDLRKLSSNAQLMRKLQSLKSGEQLLKDWHRLYETARAEPANPFERDLNRAMNAAAPDNVLLGGNEIRVLETGDEAYPPMLEAMRHARHHIHLSSFIIAADSVGREFLKLAAEKAHAGVQVRILYDRFGSTKALWRGFFARYRGVPNLRILGYTHANVLKRQFAINLRNHRKILVVDGSQAFTGGTNLAADNITCRGRPPIRDYHFGLRGPAVHELQFTFMNDWYFISRENPEHLLMPEYYPIVPNTGHAMIRVLNGEPVAATSQVIADCLFMALIAARKQILAMTPYFVPTYDILHAFKAAALRGVEVKLIVPRINNHFYSGLAAHGLYEELLASGVRVFEREPPFAHSKALLVDDTLALVGSANLDVRSLRLNYETCLAVYDDVFVNQMKQRVLDDLARSTEVNLVQWRQRPFREQLKENAALLFTPVL